MLIKEMAHYYNTTLEATARRAINLSKDMCALIIHEKDNMWAPVVSSGFPCFIPKTIFPRYLHFTKYEDSFPNQLESCDPADWGLPIKSSQYDCYYSSLFFESHARKMTLLSLEEIEEEDDSWEEPLF